MTVLATQTILHNAVPELLLAALVEQGVATTPYQLVPAPEGLLPLTIAAPEVGLVLSGHAPLLPQQLTAWRTAGLRAPVLLLGATSEEWEVTETLSLPIRLGALLARMRYYLILVKDQPQTLVQWGKHEIDVVQKILRFGSMTQMMTDKETAIMVLLAESGQAWGRDDLLREIWGYESNIDTHTLETHIYRLRRKLADLGGHGDIMTTPMGYQLSCV